MSPKQGFIRAGHSLSPSAAPILESLESRLLLDGAPGGLIGDLNSDGAVSAADIDLLTAAIRAGTAGVACDINADGAVTAADLTELLTKHLATRPGDANLDGRVDGLDFLAWQAGYPNTDGTCTWAAGDFDGDGNNTGDDFLAWQANYTYQRPASLQIVSTSLDAPADPAAPLDHIDVTFNQPVDPSSFTAGDVSVISANQDVVIRTESIDDPYPVRHVSQLGTYLVGTASAGSALFVLDVSSPPSPVVVGSYRSTAPASQYIRDVDVVGNFAYVAVGDASDAHIPSSALEVVDLSNPASPVLLTRYVTHEQSFPKDVLLEVVGQRAYLLYKKSTGSVLEIVDVTTPSSPAYLGSVAGLPAGASLYKMDLQVSGALAFVVDETGLSLIDISDPAAPAIVGQYSKMNATRVAVAGSVAYLACWGAFDVVDISDPAAPRQLASVSLQDNGFHEPPATVVLDGSRAYVDGADQNTLMVFDVSDPASPKLLGSQGSKFSVELHMFGSALYSCSYQPSGWIPSIRIVDPLSGWSPLSAGTVALPSAAWDVESVGTIAYVADGSAGLHVVNIENMAAPQEIGSVALPGIAKGLTVQENLAYVAAGAGGLQIIDVSDPALPLLVGSLATSGNDARDVVVVGSTAYVADGIAGLQIIDVSTPSSPQLMATYDTPGSARGVDVAGTLAYVADWDSDLQIIDVSIASAPALAGTYASSGSGSFGAVDVVGNMAYVVCGAGLFIFDVTVPTKPVLEGTARVSVISRVEVVGPLAYMSNPGYYSSKVSIVDISVPSSPQWVCEAWASDSEVTGAYILETSTASIPGQPLVAAQFFDLVGSVTQLSPTTFRINLSTPLPAGTYVLQIGPIIAAVDSRLLNGDGDLTAGEGNDDVFALRFEVAA